MWRARRREGFPLSPDPVGSLPFLFVELVLILGIIFILLVISIIILSVLFSLSRLF